MLVDLLFVGVMVWISGFWVLGFTGWSIVGLFVLDVVCVPDTCWFSWFGVSVCCFGGFGGVFVVVGVGL